MKRHQEHIGCHKIDLWIHVSEFSELSNVDKPEEVNIHYCTGRCNSGVLPTLREHILYEHSKQLKFKNSVDKFKLENGCCVPSSYSKQSVQVKKDGKTKNIENLVVETCHCVS